MFKLIKEIIDKILFTISFIIGVQLPAFINAYKQRLSGHLNEAHAQLDRFQQISEFQYGGDLQLLISHYLKNTDFSIQQTGQLIADLVNKVEYYQVLLKQLEDPSYINQLYSFITHIDINLAKATLNYFVLALPIESNAILTGLCFALFLSIVERSIFKISANIYKKKTPEMY